VISQAELQRARQVTHANPSSSLHREGFCRGPLMPHRPRCVSDVEACPGECHHHYSARIPRYAQDDLRPTAELE